MDILYVTTSRFSLNGKERKQFPSAGSVFAIKNLEAKGLPPYSADIVDSIEKKLVRLLNAKYSDIGKSLSLFNTCEEFL